jgi:nitrate reductase NapE component
MHCDFLRGTAESLILFADPQLPTVPEFSSQSVMLVRGDIKSSWLLVRGRTYLPTGITLSTPTRRSTTIDQSSEVPSMETFIVGIFAVIIVGATAAFGYVVYVDQSGRTVRKRRLNAVRD